MLAGVMVWLTYTVLALDRAGKDALRRAAFEENVRLALWRMDSTLSVVIGLENARPISAYKSLTIKENGLFDAGDDNPAVPDQPLLMNPASYINLHFQFDPKGKLSPSISGKASKEKQAKARLEQLAKTVSKQKLLASIHYQTVLYEKRRKSILKKPLTKQLAAVDLEMITSKDQAKNVESTPSPTSLGVANVQARAEQATQQSLNYNEQVYRQMLVQDSNLINAPPQSQQKKKSRETKSSFSFPSLRDQRNSRVTPAEEIKEAPVAPKLEKNISSTEKASAKIETVEEPTIPEPEYKTVFVEEAVPMHANLELMHPLWLDSELFLARRVEVNDMEYVQGCWINWDAVKKMLLSRAGDLLPAADLIPALDYGSGNNTRLLAAIPVRLDPGPVPPEAPGRLRLLHLFLAMAWTGLAVAAAAIGGLLFGSMKLSNRRGAFVSAVTHELRTPLTTFRMYTEMLKEGMVQDEQGRRKYIDTLHGEAQRLGHLVDNVLTYAQIEKRSISDRIETVQVSDLWHRISPRLADRAAQAEMELLIEANDDAMAKRIDVDLSAVERILFNLVDNASKYAAPAPDKRIIVYIDSGGRHVVFRVCDFGPGISTGSEKRLFRPFSKSAEQAVGTAPGVGLGLSICRRLARQMGGELSLDKSSSAGACFVLSLPLVK